MSSGQTYLLVLVATLGIAYGAMNRSKGPGAVPASASFGLTNAAGEAPGPDPCVGKERCAVVYVAPWCPACKQMLPSLLDLRDKYWKGSGTRAIKFVVGQGEPEQNRSMAKTIGDGAFVDPDGAFARKMKVEHFPTVWLTDASGKVLEQDRAAINWVNQDLQARR